MNGNESKRLDELEARVMARLDELDERMQNHDRVDGYILQGLREIGKAVGVTEAIKGLTASLEQHSVPPKRAASRRPSRKP